MWSLSWVVLGPLGCDESLVPPPVASNELEASDIVAEFDLSDLGESSVQARARLVVAGPAHPDSLHYEPRAHVAMGDEDALWVEVEGTITMLERIDDPEYEGKFHYLAEVAAEPGQQVTFGFDHGETTLLSTVEVPFDFEIVAPEPDGVVRGNESLRIEWTPAQGRPSWLQLDADCATSNALVFGPGAQGDGWQRISVDGEGTRACSGELSVGFTREGLVDSRFAQVDSAQSSRASARQRRAVSVRVEP